jgi:hypothetical protein
MAARFCSQCGAPASPSDRFCRTCGQGLTRGDAAAPPAGGAGWTSHAGDQPLAYFDVAYPPRLSRGLIFVKWLLAIPHYVVLYLYGVAVGVITFVAWFAILFTGRYPRAMFEFTEGYLRWNANVFGYVYLLRDEYPPFSDRDGVYPVRFAIEYPNRLSRWKIFLKWLFVIPHVVVLFFLWVAAAACTVIAWFAILFTGRYPRGLFGFVVGVYRWSARVNTYLYLLTDHYPPFTTALLPPGRAPQLVPA